MKQPTLYIPHGGGPWHVMGDSSFAPRAAYAPLRGYLEAIPQALPAAPKAVLVVSAHWEAPFPRVQSSANPGLLYDYGGFPEHTYRLTWPAPGAPEVAQEVQRLLKAAGMTSVADAERRFDHGTFVPMMVSWPEASIPTFQLSLLSSLDPQAHLELGRALIPLREQGVLILGSGMSFHSFRLFGRPEARAISQAFDGWLQGLATASPEARWAALRNWAAAPGARAAHPREEHLLPLMVAAGAAGQDAARVDFTGELMGVQVSALRFG